MPPPIFPWEQNRPQPTRVFNDTFPPQEEQLVVTFGESGEAPGQSDAATETASFTTESVSELHTSGPNTPMVLPTYPPVTVASDPWATFTLTNAWDDVPEIDRYVGMLQKHRRGKSGGSLAGVRLGGAGGLNKDARQEPGSGGGGRRGSRVTDFPSEAERPSLPVTPAPVRRQGFWAGGSPTTTTEGGELAGTDNQMLPAAQGVPQQSDWVCEHGVLYSPADCHCDLTNMLRASKDPVAQLQMLAKHQPELLLQRLGVSWFEGEKNVVGGHQQHEEGSTPVLSPQPVKPAGKILSGGSEQGAPTRLSSTIQEPSYTGPGAAWEKGEDVPLMETPMPPTEHEMDVLQT